MSPNRVAVALFAFGVAMAAERGEAVPGPAEPPVLRPQELNRAERPFDGSRPLPFVARVQIGGNRPPLEIRLIPGASAASAEGGRVEIARPGEPAPLQTIVVPGPGGAERLVRFTRLEDANFDGFADLLVASGGDARRLVYEFYLFDPKSGSFVHDELAREMSEKLRGQSLEFQPITGGIALRQAATGCQTGFVWLERFAVDGDHLVKVEEQEHLHTPAGCYAVQRRRGAGGKLEEISRYPVPELDRAAD